MKVAIVGVAKLLDTGEVAVPVLIGEGAKAREIDLTLPAEDIPPGGWDAVIHSKEPQRIKCLSGKDRTLWLFRGKVVKTSDAAHLTDDEQKLEVVNAVLKHEKRYQQLRRQLDAYASLDRADLARRERITEDVRLFVWQRDEGKCVKCGSRERLEFDHIIPIAKGGNSTERNIQLLCETCNRAKGPNL